MRQIALIPAGCQPWYANVVASTVLENKGDGQPVARFAYCSTMAIYMYDYYAPKLTAKAATAAGASTAATGVGTFKLRKIYADFDASTTTIAWNPSNPDELAVATGDKKIHLCDMRSTLSIKTTFNSSLNAPRVRWLAFAPHLPILAWQDDGESIRLYCNGAYSNILHDEEITAMQWHPKLPNKLIFGDRSGNITLCEVTVGSGSKVKVSKKRLEFTVDAILEDVVAASSSKSKEENPIIDIKFDPHAESYVLVAFKNGRLLLCDTASLKVISAFSRQTGKVASMEWIPSIPGGFLTADVRSGIVRVWSVSQIAPLQVMKLLSSPIHSLIPLLPTSKAGEQTLFHPSVGSFYVTTFADGSVGVYNIISQNFAYLRHGGHTETIFCCDVKAAAPPINEVLRDEQNFCVMATGSFDGTIKIWDLTNSTNLPVPQTAQSVAATGMGSNDMSEGFRCALNNLWVGKNILGANRLSTETTNGSELGLNVTLIDSFPPMGAGRTDDQGFMKTEFGIWYSVAWAPDNSFRLIGGSNRGHVIIYDAKKARMIGEHRDFHKGAIYSVCWSPLPKGAKSAIAGLAASCSSDGFCYIFNPEDGGVIKKYRHPDEAYGCDWNTLNTDYLATGCMDGRVQVFDISQPKETPKHTFLGHKGRTFNVVWSPLVSYWLASSSDDCDVRVWSTKRDACIAVLTGHTKRVRGLAWSPTIPQILISGSWDNELRVWNVSTKTCLQAVGGHVADIYGLCALPNYPMLVASTSRDNTMRFWSMEKYATELKWNVMRHMAAGDFEEAAKSIYFDVENADVPAELKMSGPFVQRLCEMLVDRSVAPVQKWRTVFEVFCPLQATGELWDMVAAHVLGTQTIVPCHSGSLLRPKSGLRDFYEMRAQSMESPKLMQQLLSGTISVPPVKHTPVYQSSDTQASANTLTLSNATRNEMKDIRDAADVRMKLGQVKKYCDTLCSLGEWDKALAVAPALGLDYWRSLIKRYGKRVQTDSELSQVAAHRHALVPLMLAAGDVASAVDVLVEESDLENAYLVAVSAEAGSFDFSSDCAKPANGAAHALEGGIAALSMSPTGTTIDAAAVMAAAKKLVIKKVAALGVDQQNKTTNARTPSAIKIGSTWKMSVGDVMGAFENLVNGGELDHALGLATVFDFIDQKHQILRKLELQLDEEKKLALAM